MHAGLLSILQSEVVDRFHLLEHIEYRRNTSSVSSDAIGGDQNSPEIICISSTSSPLGPRKNMFFAIVQLDVLTVWMGEGACPQRRLLRSDESFAGAIA